MSPQTNMWYEILDVIQRFAPIKLNHNKTEERSVIVPVSTLLAIAALALWYRQQVRHRHGSAHADTYEARYQSDQQRTYQPQYTASDLATQSSKSSNLIRHRDDDISGNNFVFNQYINSYPNVSSSMPNNGAIANHHVPSGSITDGASTIKAKAQSSGMTYVREHLRRPRGHSRGACDQGDRKF